jgi:hypothetical protein
VHWTQRIGAERPWGALDDGSRRIPP